MKLQILITSFLLFCGIILNAQNNKTSLQTGRISSAVNKIKEGNAVSCSEKEYKNQDSLDPFIVETCLFKSFKFRVVFLKTMDIKMAFCHLISIVLVSMNYLISYSHNRFRSRHFHNCQPFLLLSHHILSRNRRFHNRSRHHHP